MTDGRPVVLLTDAGFFTQRRKADLLGRVMEIADLRPADQSRPDVFAGQVAEADVLLARRVKVSRALLAPAERLRGVVVWAAGFDGIDLDAASDLGVVVANTPMNAPALAEATFTFILALSKRLPRWVEVGVKGDNKDALPGGFELLGKTLGVVGYGHIGRYVARLGRAFGMQVLATSPRSRDDSGVEFVPLEELLQRSDVVSLHTALTPETRHLINAERLALMKPSAYLINTARGSAVDEPALIRALQEGRLAGAGLDVFEQEPPALDNPLLHMPNVIATPHGLGRTAESTVRMGQAAVEGILDILAGRVPEHALNPEAARRLAPA